MASKSIWMMGDDDFWEVSTRTSTMHHANQIKVKDLRRFMTKRERLKEHLYRMSVENAILRYLEVVKDIKVGDIVNMTIKHKEKP